MTRAVLPHRRLGDLVTFEFGEIIYTMTVGRFEDGRPVEVFVDAIRTARGRSVNTTLALQHGAPVETMQAGISRLNQGDPATVIGHVLDEMCRPIGGDDDALPPRPPRPQADNTSD